jgi:glycosyltransferase involved in cell wall biosynthesis
MGSKINFFPAFGRRSPGVLKICFAGRLIESKGVDCLLRAVSILKDRGVQLLCTIAGQGPVSDQLQILASQLGISDCVDFCGLLSIEGVASLLRDNDVLVLPSRRTRDWQEQFGRILAEAMAQATVTVGSATGAIPEVIGSDDLIFEEDNAIELADILDRLRSDSTFFQSHQQRLWIQARDKYDNEVLTDRRVAFLQQVITATQAKQM